MGSKQKFSNVHCSACGRVLGKRPGVQVVLDVVCADPFCQFQGPPRLNEARDALIVFGILEGIAVVQIARSEGISRQRAYQVFSDWKSGI